MSSASFSHRASIGRISATLHRDVVIFGDAAATPGRGIPDGDTFAQIGSLSGHMSGGPLRVLVSSDARFAIAACASNSDNAAPGTTDLVLVWDLAVCSQRRDQKRQQPTAVIEPKHVVEAAMALAPSAAVGGGVVGLRWDTVAVDPTGRYLVAVTAGGPLPHLVFFDLHARVAVPGWHDAVRAVSLAPWPAEVLAVSGSRHVAPALAWAPDGRVLLLCGEGQLFAIDPPRDSNSALLRQQQQPGPSSASSAAACPWSGDDTGIWSHLCTLDALTLQDSRYPDALEVAPNGKFAVISFSGENKHRQFWVNLATFEMRLLCTGNTAASSCSISHDSSAIITSDGRIRSALFGLEFPSLCRGTQVFLPPVADEPVAASTSAFQPQRVGETDSEYFYRALTLSPPLHVVASDTNCLFAPSRGMRLFDVTANSTNYAQSVLKMSSSSSNNNNRSSSNGREDALDSRLVSDITPISESMLVPSRNGRLLVTCSKHVPISVWVRVRGAPLATVSLAGLCAEGGGDPVGIRAGAGGETVEVLFAGGQTQAILLPDAARAKLGH